jgi:hypothetical protein
MGRVGSILLMILLSLVAAIAGNNSQIAPSGRDVPPPAVTAPSALSLGQTNAKVICSDMPALTLFHTFDWVSSTSTSDFARKDPPLSDRFIKDFLFDHSPQPCWIRTAQGQGTSLNLNRVSSETKLDTANMHRFARSCRQAELNFQLSFSKSLLESSPPGFFLLI